MGVSRRSAFLVYSLALLVSSCGSDSPGGGGSSPTCQPFVTTIDLESPVVSLRTDVMPIFRQSCTFASCHGGGTRDLVITAGDAAATYGALVDVAAPELPRMKLVEPGDPTNSYLMKKMDGDVCLLEAECVAPCVDTMPQGSSLLEVRQRDIIRRWIAQGAADN